jgi:hypothetical protein
LIDKVGYTAGRMPATDLHQHLWPEGMQRLLARRTAPPRLRRDDRGWTLELAGEAPSPFDLSLHDPGARAESARADGLERVIVAPSTPLGIEALPAGEAQPLLERLADRGAPLLVHPGPASHPAAPGWWPAMTSYVAAMQAAWLARAEWGRPAHPELRVVWALLAGGAPLHAERLAARGGPAGAVHDDRSWYDVSSYGPKAVDAMLRVVGVDRLVHGSDRPVVDPPSLATLGPAYRQSVTRVNPARVLS